MTNKYFLEISPQAQKDIEERAGYIEEKGSLFASQAYVSGLYAFFEKYLSKNPYIYQERDDLSPGLGLRVVTCPPKTIPFSKLVNTVKLL